MTIRSIDERVAYAARRACDALCDTLCATASEPESLVGRRVRVPHLGLSGCISAKLNPQWQVDFDDGGMDTFFRDDFELLEDDNG